MKAQIVQREFDGIPGKIGPLAERSLVTEWEEIPLEGFRSAFSDKAGSLWSRVEKIFVDYGQVLSVAVASALMYAEEAGKLGEYLDKLDKHYIQRRLALSAPRSARETRHNAGREEPFTHFCRIAYLRTQARVFQITIDGAVPKRRRLFRLFAFSQYSATIYLTPRRFLFFITIYEPRLSA